MVSLSEVFDSRSMRARLKRWRRWASWYHSNFGRKYPNAFRIFIIILALQISWIVITYCQLPHQGILGDAEDREEEIDDLDEPLPTWELPGPASLCRPFDPSVDYGRSIFFLETTGEPCLTPRQACSVESAARANPQMPIVLYMGVDSGNANSRHRPKHQADTGGNRRQCDVMNLLLKNYANIRIVNANLIEYLQETYLWDNWYLQGQLNRSSMPHVHLSDAVRLALLRKSGGIYLDLDVVVLRPLHCLRNTAGYVKQINNWIENGVLTFEPKHPFVQLYMKLAAKIFRPDFRETMGPPTLGTAFKFFCNIPQEAGLEHSEPYTCHNGHRLQLQPPDAFYAISHEESHLFYQRRFDVTAVNKLANSYLSHVYFHTKHRVPLTSLYATLARHYCPAVYQQALVHDF